MEPFSWLRILAFLGKHWKALALLIALIAGLGWAHHLGAKSRQPEVDAAKAQAATCQANYQNLQSQLADAARAAKAAKVEAAKAAEAANKRLQAREAYWKHLYAKDPQARAWGEQDIPPSVLEGLH